MGRSHARAGKNRNRFQFLPLSLSSDPKFRRSYLSTHDRTQIFRPFPLGIHHMSPSIISHACESAKLNVNYISRSSRRSNISGADREVNKEYIHACRKENIHHQPRVPLIIQQRATKGNDSLSRSLCSSATNFYSQTRFFFYACAYALRSAQLFSFLGCGSN